MDKKRKILKTIGYWLLLNAGTLLIAAGVYFFKAPNHFATGGVSGIAIVISSAFPNVWWLKQSYIVMVINIILLIIGFIFLGKGCTLKTLYCTLAFSAENMLFEWLFGSVVKLPLPLTTQPLLELVYAILLTGIGSAILFNCKASSGGTDIVALIIKKYSRLDTGKALLITDFFIALSTFFVVKDNPVQAGLYSLLGLFAKAFVIDGVIENIGKTKYITIITSHPEEIGEYILKDMKRDFTSYKAQGGYTGDEKTVLITVCKRGEALKLKHMVKLVDEKAFTIITDANEILGKGFREQP